MATTAGMAEMEAKAQERRRAALAAAFAEVTTGKRVRLSATMSIPEVLLREGGHGQHR